MEGLCEGGNEPAGFLKAIYKGLGQQQSESYESRTAERTGTLVNKVPSADVIKEIVNDDDEEEEEEEEI
ncbi:hypothetical protein ANN_23017 [Periplaneta americana]|uniref:Uncharacterized protein n=1 Tax=Periplaneta americana TaxID=6978 RepID=A0ABQ8SJX7_PERAM|nr:hypothetical protein ANN_23017 [Periplaneta americana]